MPRQQTPLAKAKLTGQDKVHPERYRDRSEPKTSKQPVGAAPGYLSKEAKAVWKELSGTLGWLEREDRPALESAAIAIGQVRAMHAVGEVVSGALLSAMNTAIGKLGASPTDRGKVFQQSEGEDEDDPFKAFGGVQ